MAAYIVTVITAILLTSLALIYKFNKSGMLNVRLIGAIALGSIVISLSAPYIFVFLNDLTKGMQSYGFGIFLAVAMTLLAYLLLVFMLTVLASSFIAEKKAEEALKKIADIKFAEYFRKFLAHSGNAAGAIERKLDIRKIKSEKFVDSERNIDKMGIESISNEDTNVEISHNINLDVNIALADSFVMNEMIGVDVGAGGLNDGDAQNATLAETCEPEAADDSSTVAAVQFEIMQEPRETCSYDNIACETEDVVENFASSDVGCNTVCEEDINDMEKLPAFHEAEISGEDIQSAASWQLLAGNMPAEPDIEDAVKDTGNQSGLAKSIDEAFRLKENGNYEGALLHYMNALTQKPANDLVFWIILDICSLYKELGQLELARDILESYVINYGNVMDASVKNEIERNLMYW